MKIYKYIRKMRKHDYTCMVLYQNYKIVPIGYLGYEVWLIDYDIKVCNITHKCLNYCFEEVSQ